MHAVDANRAGGVIRVARREWPCEARPDTIPTPERSEGCRGTIAAGTRYLEYLGEASAYQSGKRYCAPCAIGQWGTW